MPKNRKKRKEKLKRCPLCGIHIAKDLKFCFNCNYIFPEEKKKKKRKIKKKKKKKFKNKN